MRDCIARSRISGPDWNHAGESHFAFRFVENEPVFAGHFPGKPILPGIFQIEMARMAAEWTLGRPLIIMKIVKSKFSRMILPGETIDLSLSCRDEANEIDAKARFSCNGEKAGETQLRLRAAEVR